ncbi:expressed unknown protein [Seminavis robusta]|uniref:Uncharacterized protein n=1 Tax=Seminavis robusta TaxID=568900 RepID=A0A9N8HM90_9STRA|nr:expressed unknown protein [Seminavis robusta]|eukprot:Sro979_g227230.1 n/a (174) ;mRNA; r:16158-16679
MKMMGGKEVYHKCYCILQEAFAVVTLYDKLPQQRGPMWLMERMPFPMSTPKGIPLSIKIVNELSDTAVTNDDTVALFQASFSILNAHLECTLKESNVALLRMHQLMSKRISMQELHSENYLEPFCKLSGLCVCNSLIPDATLVDKKVLLRFIVSCPPALFRGRGRADSMFAIP